MWSADLPLHCNGDRVGMISNCNYIWKRNREDHLIIGTIVLPAKRSLSHY